MSVPVGPKMSSSQLNVCLEALRKAGAQSLAAYNAQFEETKKWMLDALEILKTCDTREPPSILFPKTPAASARRIKHGNCVQGRQLLFRSESGESEVTSSTDVWNCSKKLKIETKSIEESNSREVSSEECMDASNNDITVQRCMGQESGKTNKTFVNEAHHPNGSFYSTFAKGVPTPKKSLGANSTYVIEESNPKKSIGANTTYVKEVQNHKESIGANSTYVIQGLNPKESIGANSTYVIQGLDPKESIGANSTYVKKGPNPEESFGENSTIVLQKSGNENITGNVSNVSDQDSCASLEQSILEASRIAVEEAMKGPVRLTRNKAKAVAQRAAEQAQLNASIISNNSTSTESKAALRQARKSLSRAKAVAISKLTDCNPGKVVCNHNKKGVRCEKPVVAGGLRLRVPLTQTESTSLHAPVNKHLGVSKMPRTLSHTDLKGTTVSTASKKKGPQSKRAPVSSSNRLQELAARTLGVCQRREEIAKKKSDERAKKLQDKADQVALNRAEREKVSLKVKDTKAKQPIKMLKTTTLPPIQVPQDDQCKELFLNNIASQGHSFLSKPLHLRVPDQLTAPQKAFIPVIKSDGVPVHRILEASSYDISLDPGERSPLPSKNENDYGLDDVHTDDSSDEEENPKKTLPKWAVASARAVELHLQHEISHSQMFTFFGSKKSTPDLGMIFQDVDKRILTRRSSAVWNSPESNKVTKLKK
ncbi:Inner centromere protein [Frankliniella fusca]|uniref:Inner centromere protein n=1 Tax=Frankliniella fusca TaxID=407009 RepID=A0AAE1HH07_9NEOP|nr:Inner centromere protein [Frankliniella fusca]